MPEGISSESKEEYDYGSAENDPAGESGVARQRYRDVRDQALKRAEAWGKTLAGVFETASLLLEAKSALAHGEFQTMVGETLPFAPRTAQMLMAIGHDSRLTNTKFTSLLPPSWYSLYELTKLDDADFDAAIADGTIRPDMTGEIGKLAERLPQPWCLPPSSSNTPCGVLIDRFAKRIRAQYGE